MYYRVDLQTYPKKKTLFSLGLVVGWTQGDAFMSPVI